VVPRTASERARRVVVAVFFANSKNVFSIRILAVRDRVEETKN